MNTLKRTLALMAALAMTATAFVGCGEEEKKDDKTSATEAATDAATDAPEEETTEAPTIDPSSKSTEVGEVTLGTGGDTFTVAAWNADDVPFLIAQWKGIDFETIKDQLANDEVEGIKFINFGVGGGEAPEKYDQLFAGGGDLDVFFAEADWALRYINDDTKSAPLADLGFSDANFAEIYSYTDEIGKDKNGVRKGVSWQAATGGFVYRADLAEQYLGVKTPAEMQAKVGTWDDFVAAAQTISEQSGGKTALADTLGGMWQAFACGRTQPWVVDNKLVIDDFCKDFADTAKALWDCGGITKNSQWSDEWQAAGQDDSCMGYFASTWGMGGFVLNSAGGVDGATYGKWAVCEGPQAFYWGGTWMLVTPFTDNAEEAQALIKTATVDNDAMKAYATAKPEYVNNKVVMQELVDANTVMNEDISGNFGGQNYFAELHENAQQIDFEGLITEYDATVKTNFVNAVKEQYLDAGASWEDTEEAFKDLVAEAITTLDWE